MRIAFGCARQRNWDKCDNHAAICEKSIEDQSQKTRRQRWRQHWKWCGDEAGRGGGSTG